MYRRLLYSTIAVMAWLFTFPIPLIVFPTGPLSTVTAAIPVKVAVSSEVAFKDRSSTLFTISVYVSAP